MKRPFIRFCLVLLCVTASFAGCDRISDTEPPAATTPEARSQPDRPTPRAPALKFDEPGDPAPTRTPAAERIVAIGDIHGDLDAFQEALALAKIVDERGDWSGGEAILVQTGDLLDRGDDEPEILALLERLEGQSEAAGGQVIVLNGNHETMNVRGDLRYVTDEGFSDFQALEGLDVDRPGFERVPEQKRARLAAFLPGGPIATLLAHHNMVAIVGNSVFVHGGVLPGHVDYGLERINDETRRWMRGEEPTPAFMQNPDMQPPNWVRLYSQAPDQTACQTLADTLDSLGAKRMVVGHTPQPSGITSACDDKAWRIDVGMSAHYGGRPQALEIRGDTVRVLGEN
jgi:hypothetical protein